MTEQACPRERVEELERENLSPEIGRAISDKPVSAMECETDDGPPYRNAQREGIVPCSSSRLQNGSKPNAPCPRQGGCLNRQLSLPKKPNILRNVAIAFANAPV